jgi:predicted RNase H-like HicB family nuclease
MNSKDKNKVSSEAARHDKLGDMDGHHIQQVKIIVERHPDGYVAYPLGVRGVVVGEGDTYEAAVADVKSAIKFHVESFGPEVLEIQPPVLEAFIAEAAVEI